jgi:phytoene dehydrogenase-like protein
MSDAYYNVIVVGTELPGLISAAILAKQGYRVLVVGHESHTNCYKHEGYPFIRRPWLFSGFETSTVIKKVFADLSLSLEMHNRPKPFSPFYQVVLPGHRIDVVGKEERFKRELRREFPADTAQIQTFYQQVRAQNEKLSQVFDTGSVLPPQGFFEQRAHKKVTDEAFNGGVVDPLKAFPEGHPFRAFVLGPMLMGTACSVSPYSALQVIRSTTHLSHGLFDIEGNIDALKHIFIEKVKGNCGDYREKVVVERCVVKRGSIREIVVRDRREVIGCDVLICNMDVKRFFNLVPQEDQKQRFHLKIHELQPTHLLYTVNFALRASAIPQGMGQHVITVRDASKPLENENLMLLCVDPAGLPEPELDARVVSASVRLNARQVRPTIDNIEAHTNRIVEGVCDVIPFFHENLLAQGTSWVGMDKRTRNMTVDTNEFVPILGPPLDDTLDASPVACRTAYKNVLVAGDHLHAGLGFEGAFMGSLNAVELTSGLVTRKTILNK